MRAPGIGLCIGLVVLASCVTENPGGPSSGEISPATEAGRVSPLSLSDKSVRGPLTSVFVKYRLGAPPDRVARAMQSGVRTARDLPRHRWIAMVVTNDAAGRISKALRRLPWVDSVEVSESGMMLTGRREFSTTVTRKRVAPFADLLPWGVNDADADQVRSIVGEFGNGVKVGLIDGGVDCTHSDLSGRIVGGHDFPNIGSGAGCVHFTAHGTGTAGILAASANSAGVIGMAPEVDLYSITACDSMCEDADLASAINWAIDNNMDVISYSIGNCGGTIATAMTNAVEDAVAAGIIFVAAAGNGSAAPPCNSSSAVSTVARIAGVIAVSAIDSTHTYLSAHQHGADIDISAPTYVVTDAVGGGTQVLDGTSAATPHVAGAAALLIGAGYAPSAVYGRLTGEAVDRGSSGKDNYYGYGSLDALAAVRRGPQVELHPVWRTPHLGVLIQTGGKHGYQTAVQSRV